MTSKAIHVAAVVAGLAMLVAARATLMRTLSQEPFYKYGFEWFLKLGPGERGFLAQYLLLGAPAAGLLAWGASPWLARFHAPRGAGSFRVAQVLAAFAVVAVLLGGRLLLQNQVTTDDEYGYLFQSRLLTHGEAAVAAPAGADFLTNVFVVTQNGKWFGQYPPGHPLALVPGLLAGWPRLVPVLLAGVNVWLTALLLRALMGTGAAALGAGLLVTSPLFLLTGSTLLSHPTSYAALALACVAATRTWRRPGVGWAAATGAAMGMLLITRPWTGVTLGLFPVAAVVWTAWKRRRGVLALAGAAAGSLFVAFFLWYNWRVSGNPLVTGYQAVRGPGITEFGFGTVIPDVHVHTPIQGIKNAGLLFFRFQFWAWGWPLALIPAAAAAWRARGPEDRLAVLAAMMTAVGFLSYVPYWSIGVNDSGPVKTYEILLPFTVLTVLGARRWASRRGAASVAAWMGASALCAGVLFWPPQLTHLRQVARDVAEPLAEVDRVVTRPAVVFVDRMQGVPPSTWVYGWPNPDPSFRDPVLYVEDQGAEDIEFCRLHPGRHPYLLDRDKGRVRIRPISVGRGRSR